MIRRVLSFDRKKARAPSAAPAAADVQRTASLPVTPAEKKPSTGSRIRRNLSFKRQPKPAPASSEDAGSLGLLQSAEERRDASTSGLACTQGKASK